MTPLTSEEVGSVRRLHPDGICDHAYDGCREAQWVATIDVAMARETALREALDKIDVGIYPAASPDGPRTPWQDGWNAGVIAVTEAVESVLAILSPEGEGTR